MAMQKKALFSHADPTLAIKEMKTITSHLHSTRDLLHQSLDQLSSIKLGISNTSSNLIGTSEMYDDYDEKTKKSSIYIH